jgi:translation initiation factor IF-3
MYNSSPRRPQQREQHRINWQIRVPNVRLVKDEQQLGIMPTEKARKLAQEEGLDLVEVVPNANPPVARLVDYGQFKYEQQKRKKEAVKRQKESMIEIKELRLTPNIADHDIEIKINQAKKFLESGMKVIFSLKFKGAREMAHKDKGFLTMKKIIEGINELAIIEKHPKLEGNKLICCIAPK